MKQAQFKLEPEKDKDRIFFKSAKDPLRISCFISDYPDWCCSWGEIVVRKREREHEKMKQKKKLQIFEAKLVLGRRRSCLGVFFLIPALPLLLPLSESLGQTAPSPNKSVFHQSGSLGCFSFLFLVFAKRMLGVLTRNMKRGFTRRPDWFHWGTFW